MTDLHTHRSRGHRVRLRTVLVMTAAVLMAELVAGIWSGSLSLLADAGHMSADVLGLGMALAALVVADRGRVSDDRTFGLYRMEILAALANAVLLIGVAGYILYEAATRLDNPPSLPTGTVLVVGTAGLVVNLIGWRLLRPGASRSLNMRGAYLEVVADLIGSVGVIFAALVVRYTGWLYADPLIGAGIALFILPRAWRLGRSAVRILVQAAPHEIDLDDLRRSLASIPGVIDVHDLHVWTLTSEMNVASVHLMTPDGVEAHGVLDEARHLLEKRFSIAHATLQVEPDSHQGCAELKW